jgi:hypothetical protein
VAGVAPAFSVPAAFTRRTIRSNHRPASWGEQGQEEPNLGEIVEICRIEGLSITGDEFR